MGGDSVGMAGGDEFLGRTSIEAGNRLVPEPDDGAILVVAEKVGRGRDDARDFAEPLLGDRRRGMPGERIAVDPGEPGDPREGNVQCVSEALRRNVSARRRNQAIDEGTERLGCLCGHGA